MAPRFLTTFGALVACLCAAGCAMTSSTARISSSGGGYGNDVIHLARARGIFNWEVVNEDTIYVQDNSRQWYRGEFMSPCIGLQFQDRIRFDYEPNGDFSKFSSIRHEGRSCHLRSLTRIDGPPSRDRSIRG